MNKALKMATNENYRKQECIRKLNEVNKRQKEAWSILDRMNPKERIEYLQNN